MRRGALTVVALCAIALGFAGAAQAAPKGCDPFDKSACLLPWPNDYFRKDGHLALTASMMPRNTSGVAIEPSDQL